MHSIILCDFLSKFCHLPEIPIAQELSFEWSGQLTKGQQAISVELCETAKARENRLVWAVTGAGKTEMLFAVLHQTLQEGDELRWLRRVSMFA